MYVEFRGDWSLRGEFTAVFLQWTRRPARRSGLPWEYLQREKPTELKTA